MKKNNRLFLAAMIITISLFLSGFNSLAQQPPPNHDEVEARRIGFITKELQLTPDEAKVFWPVYNKFRDEMDALRKGRASELLGAKMNFDSMTAEEVSKLIDNEFASRQKEIDLQRRYNVEFKKVLPVKKVARLYRAEQQFKVNLIKDMPQGQGSQRPRGEQGGNHPPNK
ncbi:MAG: hypothetical protein LH473_01635 [Chitinophagales bacterium]|nr:hypothetical protein [Chitinophagales bacterium]